MYFSISEGLPLISKLGEIYNSFIALISFVLQSNKFIFSFFKSINHFLSHFINSVSIVFIVFTEVFFTLQIGLNVKVSLL